MHTRSTHLSLVTLAVVAQAIIGCATTGQVRNYQTQSIELSGIDSQILLLELQDAIDSSGWTLTAFDVEHGVLEALTPNDRLSGTETRERWRFEVQSKSISVAMRMEVQWEAGDPWATTDYVCESYAYLRERDFLQRFGEAIAGRYAVGFASTSVSMVASTDGMSHSDYFP